VETELKMVEAVIMDLGARDNVKEQKKQAG
jgi:hypothetical protein